MTIAAVDPGDTTGIAYWSEDLDFLGQKQVKMEDIVDAFQEIMDKHGPITTVIVEDYVLFAKRAMQQSGSRMKASQGIGTIRALSQIYKFQMHLQPASIKSVAIKWAQIKMPSKHDDTHEYDAYLHGYYWLVRNRNMPTQLDLEKARERAAQG